VTPIIAEVQVEPSFAKEKDRNQLLTRLNNAQVAADGADLVTACSNMVQFDKTLNRIINKGDVGPIGADWLADSNDIQVAHC